MAKDLEQMTPAELKAQADAILSAADAAEAAEKQEMPAARPAKKSVRKKAADPAEPAPVMTDEEARKAGILRLDDKQVAALPAAAWLSGNEKLRELLAKGRKKGKLDSGDRVTILYEVTVGDTTWGNIEEGWISMDYVDLG